MVRGILKNIFSTIKTYEEWNSSRKKLYRFIKFVSELLLLILFSVYSFSYLSREGEYKVILAIVIIIATYSVLYAFLNVQYIESHFNKTREDISQIPKWITWFNSLSIGIATSGVVAHNISNIFDSIFSLIAVYLIQILLAGTIWWVLFSVVFSSIKNHRVSNK